MHELNVKLSPEIGRVNKPLNWNLRLKSLADTNVDYTVVLTKQIAFKNRLEL